MQNKVGHRIRHLRKKAGFNQTDLAKLINVGRTTIVSWETGKRSPGIEEIVLLAKHFGVSTDDLINFDYMENNRDGMVPKEWYSFFKTCQEKNVDISKLRELLNTVESLFIKIQKNN